MEATIPQIETFENLKEIKLKDIFPISIISFHSR